MRAKYEREKQKRKIEKITPAIVRRLYGRDRDIQELAARFRTGGEGFEANASQALFLSYNGLIQKQLAPSQGNLVERLSKQTDNDKTIHEAFLSVLSRLPSEDEENRIRDFLSRNHLPRPDKCRELVSALLCSSEFRFNH